MRARAAATRLVAAGATTLGLVAGSVAVGSAGAAMPEATVFAYTGGPQTYVVPDGVCGVRVDARGAQGGGGSITEGFAPVDGGHTIFLLPSPGGRGGEATSSITVTPGESLQVNVGGQGDGRGMVLLAGGGKSWPDAGDAGWNGGGVGGRNEDASVGYVYGGGGGGASDVRRGGTSLADRVVVAGGGGGWGAGSGQPDVPGAASGGVGGDPAAAGGPGYVVGYQPEVSEAVSVTLGTGAGGGGAAAAGGGGAGGTAGSTGSVVATMGGTGSLGVGGAGASWPHQVNSNEGASAGGGGGGGLFGGGGGGSTPGPPSDAQVPQGTLLRSAGAGGGGGSSLGDVTRPGVREGNGQVTITPIPVDCPAAPTPAPATAPAAQPVATEPTYTG